MVDRFDASGHHERAVLVANRTAHHALDTRFSFCAVAVSGRVRAKRVLHRRVKVAELRRRVRNDVVDEFVAERDDLKVSAQVPPAAGERTHDVAEASVRTVATHERAHAAEGQVAEAAVNKEASVAPEKPPALAQSTRVGPEAVFEHHAHLYAVAEVFGGLDAHARADVLTGEHLDRGRVGAVHHFALFPREAVVEHAVDLNVRSCGAR